MNRKTKKKISSLSQKTLFGAGLLLFALGIYGTWNFYQRVQTLSLDEFLAEDTAFFAQLNLDQSTVSTLVKLFPSADLSELTPPLLKEKFPIRIPQDITPWAGKRMALGIYPDKEFVLGLEYRSKKRAETFIKKLKLPGESFETETINDLEVLTPAYSSNIVLTFLDRTLIIASSRETLTHSLSAPQKLREKTEYRKVVKDIPQSSFLFSFIDTKLAQPLFWEVGASKKPLLEAVTQTLPALGIGIREENNALALHTKILNTGGIFPENTQPINTTNQTIPELARFAPKDVLFFMNGTDFYQKYLHTKSFLSQFHPQFAIIFDGILRAESKSIFGENFDLEKNLLTQLHGQYALLFDFTQADYPLVHTTFVSQFGGNDPEENLSHLHDAIHYAQSKYSTKTRSVDLPDGTTREELIAVAPEEIPIQKETFYNVDYFTAENPVSGKKFSYAVAGNYFILSTHEEGLRSVLSTLAKQKPNISENEDFRESVLFRYSPSESYGFMNFSKFGSALTLLSEFSEPESFPLSLSKFLQSNVRNMTFARKSFPDQIYFTLTLFAR